MRVRVRTHNFVVIVSGSADDIKAFTEMIEPRALVDELPDEPEPPPTVLFLDQRIPRPSNKQRRKR